MIVGLPEPGHERGYWAVCGHVADSPVTHDPKRLHRHWCPACEPGRRDPQCSGVAYRNVTQAPVAPRPVRCSLCGVGPARLYPCGRRCDLHSPGAAVADSPESATARTTVRPAPQELATAPRPHYDPAVVWTYAPTQVHTTTTGRR